MTTSTHAPAPLTIPTPPDAVHLGEWELSDDDRIAHRASINSDRVVGNPVWEPVGLTYHRGR
jgi:hypothetical protein